MWTLRKNLTELVSDVGFSRRPMTITRNGKPIARLVPVARAKRRIVASKRNPA